MKITDISAFAAVDIDEPQRGRVEPSSSVKGMIMATNELAKAIELLTRVEWPYGECAVCHSTQEQEHYASCELGKFLKTNNCPHSAQSWWYDEAGEKHCRDCEDL